jgi:hypothetical protein
MTLYQLQDLYSVERFCDKMITAEVSQSNISWYILLWYADIWRNEAEARKLLSGQSVNSQDSTF